MKKLYTLVFLIFAGTTICRSQTLSTDVTNNYSLSVIFKVQDVVNAANIDPSEQVPLANFFQSEITVINNAVSSNATSQQLDSVQAQLIPQFQAILTPKELALFSANRKTSVYAVRQPITTQQ